MSVEVSNYELACTFIKEQLEFEIILCARNLVAANLMSAEELAIFDSL